MFAAVDLCCARAKEKDGRGKRGKEKGKTFSDRVQADTASEQGGGGRAARTHMAQARKKETKHSHITDPRGKTWSFFGHRWLSDIYLIFHSSEVVLMTCWSFPVFLPIAGVDVAFLGLQCWEGLGLCFTDLANHTSTHPGSGNRPKDPQ